MFTSINNRFNRSISILEEYNIPYLDSLSFNLDNSNAYIRSKEEIAKRFITCLVTIQVAFDKINNSNMENSKKFFLDILDKFDCINSLTPNEKKIFFEPVDNEFLLNMTWKYESIYTLFWALSKTDSMPFPDKICDFEAMITSVSNCSNLNEFLESCTLRDIDSILDEADLILRYHWACVDATTNDLYPPSNLDIEVVYERHHGFNWLINLDEKDNWDSVSINT